jgi:exonuclease VII large subunit
MDREWKELLEQKFLIFSKREDIERLRQEVLSQFFKLREEHRNSFLQWVKEMKEAIEKLKEEWRSPNWESAIKGIGKEVEEISNRLNQEVRRELQWVKEGLEGVSEHLKGEIASSLQRIKEESLSQISSSAKETRMSLQEIREVLKALEERVNRIAEERTMVSEKLKEGFEAVREELGSMIRFSYGDLERRLNALEARVKALEKMVLP